MREPGSPSPSFPVQGRPLCPPQLSSIRPHPQASWSERCFPCALPSPAAQRRPGCVVSVTRTGCDLRRMEVGRGGRGRTHTANCTLGTAGIGSLWALAVVLSILSALKCISSSKQNCDVKDRASLLWRKLCLVHTESNPGPWAPDTAPQQGSCSRLAPLLWAELGPQNSRVEAPPPSWLYLELGLQEVSRLSEVMRVGPRSSRTGVPVRRRETLSPPPGPLCAHRGEAT